MCVDCGVVPSSFCAGVLSNIPQRGKNQSHCTGYRPITVSSVLSKVLELLLLPEILDKFRLDYPPLGYHQNLSCAFVHRLVKKAIDKSHRLGSCLFVCSVDISAAFNSVVQSQVFLKLIEYGVNASVLALVSWWYSGSFVKNRLTGDHLSRPIRLVRGLRQGSVLSLILFNTLTSGIKKKQLLEDSASIYAT